MSKATIYKFLGKMKDFSKGKISWEGLIKWIEMFDNKKELYSYLFVGAKTMIAQIQNDPDNEALKERMTPMLEWVVAQSGGAVENGDSVATDIPNEAAQALNQEGGV